MNTERDTERLKHVDPRLVDEYFRLVPVFEMTFPGCTVTIPATGGYRPPDMQQDAHLGGSSGYDGRHSFSKHQAFPSLALDFAIIENGQLVSDGTDRRYSWVGGEFHRSGFLWGGFFVHAKDWDHVEIRGAEPTAQQVATGFSAYMEGQQGADVASA